MSVPYRADVQTVGASPQKSITSVPIAERICEGEKMSEYIKREDAINAVKMLYGGFGAIANINAIPSADVVERKRGKWIGGNGVDYVRCGCCHKDYDWVSQAQYYNFCPNCGADMRHPDD